MAQIRSPVRVRTNRQVPWRRQPRAQIGTEHRLAVGSRRHEVNPPARAEEEFAEAGHGVPALVSKGSGGIDMETSSVSRVTSAPISADSYARTNFATIASSAGEPEAGAGSRPVAGGCWRCRVARARLRALVTDSTVESSMPATSLAWNPRTSRKMSTASWRGGRT